MHRFTNYKHKNLIPIDSLAENECRNNAKSHEFHAYKPYSYVQYGLQLSSEIMQKCRKIKHKTLFLYTVWPKISAEIVQKVTKVKHENLIPIYSMAEKIVQK